MPSSAYPLRSAGWGNQPRQLAMDPLSKISQIVLPSRQGPQSLLPQEVPDSFAKVVPEGQTPVPWRTGIAGPPGGLRGIVSEGQPHGMGGIRQASLRRARTGSQVLGPIHAPRRHFQPAPVIDGGRSSHPRMEALCRRQSDQDDDIGGGRIHSSFSPSRAALRLCSHPSFWLSGQSPTKGKTGAVPVLAGWLASCHRTRRRFPGLPPFTLPPPAPPIPRFQVRSANPPPTPPPPA